MLGDWSSSAIEPGQASRVLSLYGELAADPVTREPIRAHIALLLDELETLLRGAIEAGELKPCDPGVVARAMLAGVAGMLLFALLSQAEASLDQQVRDAVETTLSPYLPKRARRFRRAGPTGIVHQPPGEPWV